MSDAPPVPGLDPREAALELELRQLDADELARLLKWIDELDVLFLDDVRSYDPVKGYSPMAVAAGWGHHSPLYSDKHPEALAAADGVRQQPLRDHEHMVEESLRDMLDHQVDPPAPWRLHQTAGVAGSFYAGERARADLRSVAARLHAEKLTRRDVSALTLKAAAKAEAERKLQAALRARGKPAPK